MKVTDIRPITQSKTGRSYSGVLFVVPRLHTNMRGWVDALVAMGVSVRILAVTAGFTEDHTGVERKSLVASRRAKQNIARRLEKEPDTPPEQIVVGAFFPSFRRVLRQVRDFPFDAAIVRAPLRWGLPVLILLRLFSPRSRLRFYHQRPLVPPVGQKQYKTVINEWALRVLLGFVGAKPVSPVLARHALTDDEFRIKLGLHSRRFMPFLVGSSNNHHRPQATGRLRILMVGKFRVYKSHDVLVEALHLLERPVRQKIDLIIAGQAKLDSEIEYLRTFRKTLSDVEGLGSFSIQVNVKPAEMEKYYQWASCALLTSNYEVAAISPLEGMGHGAFPLATSENGTNCYFQDGKSGVLFDAGSSQSLAYKLTWLVSDPTLWESLGLASKAAIYERASGLQFLKSLGIQH